MSVLLSILLWIVVGAIAGWIATSIMGGGRSFGSNVLIGIAGAILGGLLFGLFGIGGTGFLWSIITATIGAVLLLAIVRAARGRPATEPRRY